VSSIEGLKSQEYKIPNVKIPTDAGPVLERPEGNWSSKSEPSRTRSHERRIIVIEPRTLLRHCVVHIIQAAEELDALGVASVEAALAECRMNEAALFLLSADPMSIAHNKPHIARLMAETGALVAVLGDGHSRDEIAEILGAGAVGYISMSLSAEVVVGSLRLMLAGGTFAPAEILLAFTPGKVQPTPSLRQYNCTLTKQQTAVLAALSEGKANKAIANDLKLEVGTVKACVRTLIKKLQVRNRTEVALIVAHEKQLSGAGKALFS
jgi:DNA-binding NarL/FixJ family response regulator